MNRISKAMTFDVTMKNTGLIDEIIKITGENKVELMNRIIENEHLRLINKEALIDSNNNYEELLILSNKILSKVDKTENNSNIIIDAINKIYCLMLFVLKEFFRLFHWTKILFIKVIKINKDDLSSDEKEVNKLSSESFNNSYVLLDKLKPIDIVKMLRK